MKYRHLQLIILLSAVTLTAQQRRPERKVREQATSNLTYSVNSSSETVEITNTAFEVVGPGIPVVRWINDSCFATQHRLRKCSAISVWKRPRPSPHGRWEQI